MIKKNDTAFLNKSFIDLELERNILSSFLSDGLKIKNKLIHNIKEYHFHLPAHSYIYKAIEQLLDADLPIDILTVSSQLEKNNMLELIGGDYLLVELLSAHYTSANINHHVSLLIDKYERRFFKDTLFNMIEKVKDASFETNELKGELEKELTKIDFYAKEEFTQIGSIFTRIENENEEDKPISTGIKELDNYLDGGFLPSQLNVIAGDTSTGKTSLLLNILLNIAKQNIPIALISLEMKNTELLRRLTSSESQIELSYLKRNTIPKSKKDNYLKAREIIASVPFHSNDCGKLDLNTLKIIARNLVRKKGIKVLAIDYLQRMALPKAQNKHLEIAEVTRACKELAMELNIVILLLSQVNRSGENERPVIGRLKESGAIGEDANIVLFTWRPNGKESDDLSIIIAKNRDGRTGIVECEFMRDYNKILDKYHNAPF